MRYTIAYTGNKKYAGDRYDVDCERHFDVDGTAKMEKIVAEMSEDASVTEAKVFVNSREYNDFPSLPSYPSDKVPLYEKWMSNASTKESWFLTGQKAPRPCSQKEAHEWIEEYESAAYAFKERYEKYRNTETADVFRSCLPLQYLDDNEVLIYDWTAEEVEVIRKIKGQVLYLLKEAEEAGNKNVPSKFFGAYEDKLIGEKIEYTVGVMRGYFSTLYDFYKNEYSSEYDCLRYENRLQAFLATFFPDGLASLCDTHLILSYCARHQDKLYEEFM
ncbi:hypothetical protein [uncultured Selenomonas sp.]|uniref:hypothetical protein n=1 Tax=uncultured Selenomonas sp. TaxID=159275 RepID=UPI0028DC7C2D|nr:hypothetical protein [uncultured Selenomonas sp.]